MPNAFSSAVLRTTLENGALSSLLHLEVFAALPGHPVVQHPGRRVIGGNVIEQGVLVDDIHRHPADPTPLADRPGAELGRQGKSVIFVTHDPLLAQRAERIVRVQDGLIVSDSHQPVAAHPPA